jgi:hypothetical protein
VDLILRSPASLEERRRASRRIRWHGLGLMVRDARLRPRGYAGLLTMRD